jgi:hypothetical protein
MDSRQARSGDRDVRLVPQADIRGIRGNSPLRLHEQPAALGLVRRNRGSVDQPIDLGVCVIAAIEPGRTATSEIGSA